MHCKRLAGLVVSCLWALDALLICYAPQRHFFKEHNLTKTRCLLQRALPACVLSASNVWFDTIQHQANLALCLGYAEDMSEEERESWTEQILQWMCNTQSSSDIRFACGQALTGMSSYKAAQSAMYNICKASHNVTFMLDMPTQLCCLQSDVRRIVGAHQRSTTVLCVPRLESQVVQ